MSKINTFKDLNVYTSVEEKIPKYIHGENYIESFEKLTVV